MFCKYGGVMNVTAPRAWGKPSIAHGATKTDIEPKHRASKAPAAPRTLPCFVTFPLLAARQNGITMRKLYASLLNREHDRAVRRTDIGSFPSFFTVPQTRFLRNP
jgi:hypothetical protein